MAAVLWFFQWVWAIFRGLYLPFSLFCYITFSALLLVSDSEDELEIKIATKSHIITHSN